MIRSWGCGHVVGVDIDSGEGMREEQSGAEQMEK